MPMIRIKPLGNIKDLPEEADLVEVTKQHLVVNYQTKKRGRGGGVVDHTMRIPINAVAYEEIAVLDAVEADDAADAEPVAPKRRAKATKVAESPIDADSEDTAPPAPRRRGRPPGSKNKKVEEAAPPTAPKRRKHEDVDPEDDEPTPRKRRSAPEDDAPAPRKRRAAPVEPDDDDEGLEDFQPERVGRDSAPKRRQHDDPPVKVRAARKPFTVDETDDWPDDPDA